jgi:hypothetical protein
VSMDMLAALSRRGWRAGGSHHVAGTVLLPARFTAQHVAFAFVIYQGCGCSQEHGQVLARAYWHIRKVECLHTLHGCWVACMHTSGRSCT